MSLTDPKVRNAKSRDKVYRIADEKGLCLEVRPSGSKWWRYRYRVGGKASMFSIGQYPQMSLSEARIEHGKAADLVKRGVHPINDRKARDLQEQLAKENTFRAIATAWLADNAQHWSIRYRDQARKALEKYLYPAVGNAPIKDVTAPVLRDLIKAAEKEAPTVAVMLRQWCSAIFRYAVMHNFADHDPAAALKGLVKKPKVKHHAPLKQQEIPEFLRKLDAYGGFPPTKIALRLLLLTFVRTGELRQAEWSEFDLENTIWEIPAERMKMREIHLVPMSEQVVALLQELHQHTGNQKYLFPNVRRPKTCMTNTTLNRALEYMGYAGKFSAHGFRATASTILHGLGYRSELIERQLAHAERNKSKASYNQAEYLDERRQLMQGWADQIDQIGSSRVVVGRFGSADVKN